jgi:hypothetical protein
MLELASYGVLDGPFDLSSCVCGRLSLLIEPLWHLHPAIRKKEREKKEKRGRKERE